MTNTMAVVIAVSRRDGQVTLRVSSRTSWRNLNGDVAIPVKPRFQSLPVTRNVVTATGLRGPEGFAQLRARAWQEWQDSNLQPPALEVAKATITSSYPILNSANFRGFGLLASHQMLLSHIDCQAFR